MLIPTPPSPSRPDRAAKPGMYVQSVSAAPWRRRRAIALILVFDGLVSLVWGRPWPLIPLLAAVTILRLTAPGAPDPRRPRTRPRAARRAARVVVAILSSAGRSLALPVLSGVTIVCAALAAVRTGLLSAGAVYPSEQWLAHLERHLGPWVKLSPLAFCALIALLVLASAVLSIELFTGFRRGQAMLGFSQALLFVLTSFVIYGAGGLDPGRDYQLTLAKIHQAERLTASSQAITHELQQLPQSVQSQVARGLEQIYQDDGSDRHKIAQTVVELVDQVGPPSSLHPDRPVPVTDPGLTQANANARATLAQRFKRQAFTGLVTLGEHLASGIVKLPNEEVSIVFDDVVGAAADRGLDLAQRRDLLTRRLTPATVAAVDSPSAYGPPPPTVVTPDEDPPEETIAPPRARGFSREGPSGDPAANILRDASQPTQDSTDGR